MGQDAIRDMVAGATKRTAKRVVGRKRSDGTLSGIPGALAGAAAAVLAPLAAKGVGKLVSSAAPDGLNRFADKLSDVGDGPGGAGGAVTDAVKSALSFGNGALSFGNGGGSGSSGGNGGEGKGTVPGVGKGRRMPVQQAVDIGVPVETVYNQWTQFEQWPRFMHRITDVTQSDDCTVAFSTKIWGKKKQFKARIETQRPDERIKWKVEQGITHSGVVTFHELGPRLTRVLVGLDVEPGGMLEKAARGLRHVKRAVRADLHRFKAFVEMQEVETGAWRGVIEHGKVVEEHESSYDDGREYSEFEDVFKGARAKKATPSKQRSRSSSSGRSSSGSGQRRRGATNGGARSSRSRSQTSSHSGGRSRGR
jgi:uncharacterized membrane protein